MKKKTPRQRQIERMDKMFSEIIRRRAIARCGGCERCLHEKHDLIKENGDTLPAWMQLQCHHAVKGRKHLRTKFDFDNCIGICGGCHRKLEEPGESKAFMIKHIGSDRVEQVEILAHANGRVDLDAIEKILKESLKRWREI